MTLSKGKNHVYSFSIISQTYREIELNLESSRLSCLIQRIWFLNFGNLSPSLKKFANKRIFIFNSLLTSEHLFPL